MKEKIAEIQKNFSDDVRNARTSRDLEDLRVKYLGKKGLMAQEMAYLRTLSDTEKKEAGKLINTQKVQIEEELAKKESEFIQHECDEQLKKEKLDITLPGRKNKLGSKHPITKTIDEIVDIFISMGFSVQESPEIETDYYNFGVLNFAPDHPARDMQDTFYIEPNILLRTHTSNFQGRIMEKFKPPLRLVCPGRVYRNESISSRSHVFFHQVDGLYVAENVTVSDLISTMQEFIKKLFHQDVAPRIRPSYFPFVEPGIEIDINCLLCQGSGCNICKHSGWLEIMGAGMIHPQVLRNVGYDPEKYSGFAWGLGVERIVLLRHSIFDLRLFAENDLRFLTQFPAL